MLPLPPPPPQAPIADATEETPYVKPRPPRKWFPIGNTRKGGTLSEDEMELEQPDLETLA